VLIGIDSWMRQNRGAVEGMLEAVFAGADQVRGNPTALRRAAEISAAVYAESGAGPEYWERYFHVVRQADRTGRSVELGGSAVNNLADNRLLFGLQPGSASLFAATYAVFGDIVVAQYPDLVSSYAPVREVVDTSYLEAIARRAGSSGQPEQPRFSSGDRVETILGRRAWHIGFDSGQASFSPGARADLELLLRDLLVAGAAVVEVHGHTDSLGSPQANQALSEARAFAVKAWLEQQSPLSFPGGRIRVFAHGQENPLASNATPEGRASNRRVEIVLGTNGR